MHINYDERYNDLQNTVELVAVGNRVMWCLENDTTTNTQPIYIDITDGTTTIENLEMCGVGARVFVIDLAPFIQSLMEKQIPLSLTGNNDTLCKKITITANSYGEEATTQIVKTIYAVQRSLINPVIATNVNWRTHTSTDNVYESDLVANDLSPIYLPADKNMWVFQSCISFNGEDTSDYILRVNTVKNIVTTNTSRVQVIKREIDTEGVAHTYTVGRRDIIRKKFCDHKNLMIMYLTSYGQFEYFIFDNYTLNQTVEKTDKIANTLTRAGYYDKYDIYGKQTTDEISASVLLTDDTMISKWKDIIRSTQVYVYDPSLGEAYYIKSYYPVTVEGELHFNPRKNTRQTITFTKNTEYLW